MYQLYQLMYFGLYNNVMKLWQVAWTWTGKLINCYCFLKYHIDPFHFASSFQQHNAFKLLKEPRQSIVWTTSSSLAKNNSTWVFVLLGLIYIHCHSNHWDFEWNTFISNRRQCVSIYGSFYRALVDSEWLYIHIYIYLHELS